VAQEEEVADPTRENVFVCSADEIASDKLVFQWDFTDVTKGSKVILNDMQQDKNRLIVGANQLRFNREYSIKCNAISASARGEASHRFKTVEKASDIKLIVTPEAIGVAETTMFTLTAMKSANEELHCKFF